MVGALDTCASLPEAAEPAVGSGGASTTTYHNCSCIEGGWWYLHPSGAAASGPVNKTIFGCANPDGDPLGAWCAVDPEKCARFAGYVGVDPVNTWAFDYCNAEAPSLAAKRDGTCKPWSIGEWGQCGGKSSCTDWGCADEQWAGACCASGLECRRQDPYFRQCVKPGTATNAAAALTSVGAETLTTTTGSSAAPASAAATSGGASTAIIVNGTTLAALQPKAPGTTVYVRLKINCPYELIERDVGAQAKFKADLVGWLKLNAAAPDYVYSAGVDAIWNGSAVADTHVVFTADAPADVTGSAAMRLQDGAAHRLYTDSSARCLLFIACMLACLVA